MPDTTLVMICVYFAIVRLVYSLLERRERRFVLWELASDAGFVGISLVLLSYCPTTRASFLVLLVYVLSALLPYAMERKAPIEATGMMDTGGRPIVWFGLVDSVWVTCMGATCALILAGYGENVIGPLPPRHRSADFYQAAIAEASFFLGFITNAIFAGGAALSGCMAILWAGEIWRKWRGRGTVEHTQYLAQTVASQKMVFAYFAMVVAAIGWAAVPIHTRMIDLREMMPLPR